MKKTIWRKLSASIIKLFLPAVLLLVVAFVAASYLLVNMAAVPPHAAYLVTPEQLQKFTKSGSKITDESWGNKDSSKARGWLIRGNENAPAVILLHRYGADRSWLLNFGAKLNQESNFTVLIPDLRGHGDKPLVNATTFGSLEADDLSSAVAYLRTLKTDADKPLVNQKIGVYGTELGAVSALLGAQKESDIQAIALDSVPSSTDEMLASAVASRASFMSFAAAPIALKGTLIYFQGGYANVQMCDVAPSVANRKVLLMAGNDSSALQESTRALKPCFNNATNTSEQMASQPSGYNLMKSATSEQQEVYYKTVIEFFRQNLS